MDRERSSLGLVWAEDVERAGTRNRTSEAGQLEGAINVCPSPLETGPLHWPQIENYAKSD